ncbi:MAG: fatty acid desaturase family protein [Leptonema sp. (in: bacteria)]
METKKNQFESINLAIVLFLVKGSIFSKIALPIFFFDTNWIYIILLWALFSNILWVLIHEGIHYVLFKNKKINNLATRVLSILFGSPFRILQAGHLLHHSFNRTKEEVTDLYNPNNTNTFIAYIKYYFWILFGLYFFELLSNLILFVPKNILIKIQNQYMHSKVKYNFIKFILKNLQEIKIDALGIIFLYSLIFVLYGSKWWLVVIFLFLRGFFISIMDNVYHYGTKENQVLFGYDLKMPRFLEIFLLNSNLHGFHHKKPNIPWYEVKQKFFNEGYSYHAGFFKQLIRQLKGPIKNFNI